MSVKKLQEKMSFSDLSSLTMEAVMTPMPVTVGEDTDLTEALRLLHHNKIRHLPVIRDGKLTGVLSDRDAKAVSLMPDFGKMAVADLMTPNPTSCRETTPFLEAVAEMAAKKHGCVIITSSEGEVRGVFTTQDALHLLLRERGVDVPAPTAYPLIEDDDEEMTWD